MELAEIESRNAAEEARISDLRATIRRFRGTDLSTLCHNCKRRKILAVLLSYSTGALQVNALLSYSIGALQVGPRILDLAISKSADAHTGLY